MAAHGRYSLLRKIAEGGTAEVFLAHQLGSAGFKRLVVLKRVRPGLWADESFRRMLIDEAHISMALHHSNIVQVLDLGLSGPHYFLVFELVDGWSLSQVVKRARAVQQELPLNLALHVMAQVCRALAYAHSRADGGVAMGIVHRDISPQNVLLSDQGEVKLADFGIAKARSRITTSQIGQVKGKPAYMSPEQATGAPLDARSDLFSVGTCLYWLVTGELPFNAPNELEALARVVHGNYVPPEKKRSGLPKPVAKLIAKALQHEVKDRFQTADEMLAELEKLQRSRVIEPAGQTELKEWLKSLAAKDSARPIGWLDETEAKAPAPSGDQSEEIELVDDKSAEAELVDDEDLVVVVTQASDAVPQAAHPPFAPRTWGWRHALAIGGASAALLAGGYWATRDGGTSARVAASTPGDLPSTPAPLTKSTGLSASPSLGQRGEVDAGAPDAGPSRPPADAGTLDAGTSDAAAPDGGEPLAGAVVVDAGHPDGGSPDGGGPASRRDGLDGPPDAGLIVARPAPQPVTSAVPRPAAAVIVPAKPAQPPRPPEAPRAPPKAPPKAKETPGGAAKPAPVAQGEMASVMIDSDPPGADVAIERKVYGKTPVPLRLKVGITFELVFSKPGYKTHKVLYQVSSRQGQRVRVILPR